MPQVVYTEESKQDLVRFANFLVANEAKEQAKAVITVILSNVKKLEEFFKKAELEVAVKAGARK